MTTTAEERSFRLTASRGFAPWLADSGGSLALSTYQAGRLLLLGSGPDGGISVFERDFTRPMGIAVDPDGRSFVLATQFQIYRFADVIEAGEAGGFDARYVPLVGWVTGSVDAHDVGIGPDGRPIFVNTLYSCLASVSETRNFKPIWKPPFVSALAPEDRCHLNGMCVVDGRPRFATAVSRTDVKDGWRSHRTDGGVVIDIESGEAIAEGLSMPHSPRFHDERLWLLNSGAGQFGFVDPAVGAFQPIAFCPGYARGLSFVGRFAIVGLSAPRDSNGFGDLMLEEQLRSRRLAPFCGLLVVDLDKGAIVEWARIDGAIGELYDVAVLPGVRSPSLVGFKTDEIKQRVAIEQ